MRMSRAFLVAAGLFLAGGQAFGFFSSGQGGYFGTNSTFVARYGTGTTCTNGLYAKSNLASVNCQAARYVPVTDDDAARIAYDDIDDLQGCDIQPEDPGIDYRADECAAEDVYAFQEDGTYGKIGIKLLHKKLAETYWRFVVKFFKHKKVAHIDNYCGANGVQKKLFKYLTSDQVALCGTGFCDSKFNSTNFPTCNQYCDDTAAQYCTPDDPELDCSAVGTVIDSFMTGDEGDFFTACETGATSLCSGVEADCDCETIVNDILSGNNELGLACRKKK